MHPILMVFLAFIAVALLPPLLISLVPGLYIIFVLLAIFMIYSTVRTFLGDGILTYLLTGIVIYISVIKHPLLTSSILVLQFIFMVGLSSAIFWGAVNGPTMLKTIIPQKQH